MSKPDGEAGVVPSDDYGLGPPPAPIGSGPLFARVWAWAMFEGARNPFYVTVIIYVFAAYFTATVVSDPVKGQALWGYLLSISAVAVALIAPVAGVIADVGGRRKPWLAACVIVAVPAIAALSLATPHMDHNLGAIALALVLANVSYEISAVFYNALLPQAAAPSAYGRASGLAYALANTSGFLVFGIFLAGWSWSKTPLFGLDVSAHQPERAVPVMAAICFLVLAVPIFVLTPDAPRKAKLDGRAIRAGLGQLMQSVKVLRQYDQVAKYLLARMVFNEGFIIIMTFVGVFSAGVLGWNSTQLSVMGLALSIVAIAGALLGGKIYDSVGPRWALAASILGCVASDVILVSLGPNEVFFIKLDPALSFGGMFPRLVDRVFFLDMGLAAFFVTSGLAASRAMLANLAPPEEMNRFFSLYALSGTATSFLGPLLVAVLTTLSGSQRAGLSAGVVFLVVGLAMLGRLKPLSKSPGSILSPGRARPS